MVDISHDTGISRDLIIRLLEGKNDHQHVIDLDNAANDRRERVAIVVDNLPTESDPAQILKRDWL